MDHLTAPGTRGTPTWPDRLDPALREAYLARLGFTAPPPPDLESLFALHRAQVERIPYETVWIALGEHRPLDPLAAARSLVAGRGGYCYQLNGALALLLRSLGFDVHLRVGGVQERHVPDPQVPNGNHMVVLVHGLPTEANPDGRWMVDTGLGVALHAPLPLVPGVHRDPLLEFGLRPSAVAPGGWRFEHDPRGSFAGMDFGAEPARPADFLDQDRELSTSQESRFVRVVSVSRRDAASSVLARGLVVMTRGPGGDGETTITTRADYFTLLADAFALPLPDVDDRRRDALWRRLVRDHERAMAERAERAAQ